MGNNPDPYIAYRSLSYNLSLRHSAEFPPNLIAPDPDIETESLDDKGIDR